MDDMDDMDRCDCDWCQIRRIDRDHALALVMNEGFDLAASARIRAENNAYDEGFFDGRDCGIEAAQGSYEVALDMNGAFDEGFIAGIDATLDTLRRYPHVAALI